MIKVHLISNEPVERKIHNIIDRSIVSENVFDTA